MAGDVQTCGAKDPLWTLAATKTTGGNPATPLEPMEEIEYTPKQLRAFVEMFHLGSAIFFFQNMVARFPVSLNELVERPKDATQWPEGGCLFGGKVPKDPWGNDYQYAAKGDEPELASWGADGKKGGKGEEGDLNIRDFFERRREEDGLPANERNAQATLKTVMAAEADFRSNDRDLNRIQDYWTGDVSGLYAILANGDAIKLIELSMALADLKVGSPIANYGTQSARDGYWYMALKEDAQFKKPYGQDTDGSKREVHNVDRFGFAALPETYEESGKKVFLINEGGTIFWRDFGQEVLTQGEIPPKLNGVFDGNWPTDAELSRDWHKLD